MEEAPSTERGSLSQARKGRERPLRRLRARASSRLWGGSALYAYGLTALVAVAVLSPPFRGQDDFPLSTYPMFSSRRPDWAWIAKATAEGRDGQRHDLSPALVAGSIEPMQAVATLRRALRGGRGPTRALCQRIAERVATAPYLQDARFVRLEEIEVSVLGYYQGQSEPRNQRVRARCPVPTKSRDGGNP